MAHIILAFRYTSALTLVDTYESRVQMVNTLISDLGLDVCADTRVGDVFVKGLSGGQKRRLSLGLALISKPAMILLDEPTSGLDAASAFGIMKYLSDLAVQKNIAVVATIHQPSTEIWDKFDNLCLLSAGDLIYFGRAKESINYFGNIGYICPQYSNPADYFLTLVNTDFEGHADVTELVSTFNNSQLKANILKDIGHDKLGSLQARIKPGWGFDTTNPNSVLWHFVVLTHRNFLNTFRNPGVILVRLIMYVMLGIMIGGMFWKNGDDSSDKAIFARLACLFFVFAFMVFMSIAVLPFYMWDR